MKVKKAPSEWGSWPSVAGMEPPESAIVKLPRAAMACAIKPWKVRR